MEGPTVWFTGCMHGDEIGGTVVIHEIFKKLKGCLIKGSVLAFPLMNPFGFETVSRNIIISKEDLNRSFPGDEKGSLGERIASKIFNYILNSKPSLVIDLHNDWNKSIPYVLNDPSSNREVDRANYSYSGMTGLLQIEDTDKIHSSLTYNLTRQNIPAIVLELGESFIINEKNILIGINAIWNILMKLGMVPENAEYYQYPLLSQIGNKMLQYSSLPLSSTSGIIRFTKKPGDIVTKGQKIARVYNAFGKQIENISALADGIVIGHTDNALAFPGSPVMAFGIFS
ncbi:MAG: succinylglutamate desuccinylase/aspartoacylase family protein [Bacteroidales bacterium]|nr:succinylglutamate desuccinylase/aspartoacylase family protein [Bacteroidales bacterium]MBN2764054.1 succinylglutamate desuccinylase/aspartoacylase family protein [Bacteroidales bacterium]